MTQTDYSGLPNRLADIMILEAKGGLLAVLGGHCLCERLGIGGRQAGRAWLQAELEGLGYGMGCGYFVVPSGQDDSGALYLTVPAALAVARGHGGENLPSVEEFLKDCESQWFPSMLGALAQGPGRSDVVH